MGKLQDFLMEQDRGDRESVAVQINRIPIPFIIRPVTEGESRAIKHTCQTVTYDKRTRQRMVETDFDLYNARLVAACCIDPNLRDAALQEKYGVRGAEALLDAMLLPGQFLDLLLAVQDICGFSGELEQEREEAKN